jgi:hypothetical protein
MAKSVPSTRNQHCRHGHRDGDECGFAEELVVLGEHSPEVLEPDELAGLGRVDLPAGEAVPDAHDERNLGDQDREDQGRQQRQAPTPWLVKCGFLLPISHGADSSPDRSRVTSLT